MKIVNRDLIGAFIAIGESTAEDPPQTLATKEQIARLVEAGLIDEKGFVTDKGEAYIAALEAVPLPVQRWVIPEVGHALTQQQASSIHGSGGAQPEHREASGDQAERRERVQPSGRKQRPTQPSDEKAR